MWPLGGGILDQYEYVRPGKAESVLLTRSGEVLLAARELRRGAEESAESLNLARDRSPLRLGKTERVYQLDGNGASFGNPIPSANDLTFHGYDVAESQRAEGFSLCLLEPRLHRGPVPESDEVLVVNGQEPGDR